MTVDVGDMEKLSIEQFRRFGIACCERLGCERKDKRLAKALRLLKRSLGPPLNDGLRKDAFNAANSAYRELTGGGDLLQAAACTLVCACWEGPNSNLLGNFELALEKGELMPTDQVRKIASELLRSAVEQ